MKKAEREEERKREDDRKIIKMEGKREKGRERTID